MLLFDDPVQRSPVTNQVQAPTPQTLRCQMMEAFLESNQEAQNGK